MKKFILNFLAVILLSLGFAGFLYFFIEIDGRRDENSVSPLPEFLTLSKNNQVRFLDLWFPKFDSSEKAVLGANDITAKSALVYDLSNNQTIYEKSASTKLPMASLTKIMTAIIALENKRVDDSYVVTAKDLVGEDSMGLTEGEVISFDELLHGLMLPSGNDAAEVFANNHPTGRDGFILDMNQKAKSLGLKDTNFVNPSGLQGDGDQHTTTYDLLVITRYALENFPEFAKVVATAEYSIPQNSFHKAFDLYNETNLLTTYEGVRGVKTGYTPEAGLCLVTYLDYGGHKIIGIILNSENRRTEMKTLLDYSLRKYGIAPPEYKG
ncbi:MAG TPA: D-alanyl-D-alanine carboxypeptidase family protein [Candidatus Limnocylindrales bacterium]|nr:D-alanyl-D-alanine carboxypeptidase family protein [Candidatus Limnocylindrales bacterium]